MTMRVGIAEDELEEAVDNDEEQDEEGQEEGSKKVEDKSTSVVQPSEVRALQKSIQDLAAIVSKQGQAAGAGAQAKVTALETEYAELAKTFNPQQLEAVARLVLALKKDLTDEYTAEKTVDTQKQFQKDCWGRAAEEIEKVIDQMPGADKPHVRASLMQGLLKEVADTMANQSDDRFAKARAAYANWQIPPREDFSKAVRLVTGLKPAEGNTMKNEKATSNSLDVKNSRSKATPAISKDGSVDISKLTEYERDVYVTTLNKLSGKDNPAAKEIALRALKNIVPHLSR